MAVLAVDPTRRRGGGALLGDRIRMNAIDAGNIFFRSLATRGAGSEIPDRFDLVVAACAAAGFGLVIVETPGIGQGDAAVTDIADVALYVMTPEYGAASQLEKIDMLELADVVAINKFDRRGADDAFRQVCRQWGRDHRSGTGDGKPEPVFGTIASRFNDDGVTALFHRLKGELGPRGWWPPRACSHRWPGGGRPGRRLSSHPNGTVTWPRSPRPWPATTPTPAGWSPRPAGPSRWPPWWPRPGGGASTPATWARWPPGWRRTATPRGGVCSRSGKSSVPHSPLTTRMRTTRTVTARRTGRRGGARAVADLPVRHPGPEGGPPPLHRAR